MLVQRGMRPPAFILAAGGIRRAVLRAGQKQFQAIGLFLEAGMQTNTSEPITQLLDRLKVGDAAALDALIPLVYSELRRMAASYLRGDGRTTLCKARRWCMRPTSVWLGKGTPTISRAPISTG